MDDKDVYPVCVYSGVACVCGVCPEPLDAALDADMPARSVCTRSDSVFWIPATCDSRDRMRLVSAQIAAR